MVAVALLPPNDFIEEEEEEEDVSEGRRLNGGRDGRGRRSHQPQTISDRRSDERAKQLLNELGRHRNKNKPSSKVYLRN